ncbi:hypothetical protein J2Z23_004192 [Lederbergia galactosidilyticus]|uniref:hypothetical protein n=1 Tax=Lederbergia galactosidilytica TaxID=217031 RepID=UPI001AE7A4D8|nr:hypothetical protein [Lederbergia galactosidilytica]MBP1917207.1 hypothetical protein [Lederbergia galactosidilytica]
MANLEGIQKKFTVVKDNDIWDADALARTQLECALESINKQRKKKGKKENTYLVINTDEPYADEVIEIMKRNGHWG